MLRKVTIVLFLVNETYRVPYICVDQVIELTVTLCHGAFSTQVPTAFLSLREHVFRVSGVKQMRTDTPV